jgi:hypothetical protein
MAVMARYALPLQFYKMYSVILFVHCSFPKDWEHTPKNERRKMDLKVFHLNRAQQEMN